jgi:AcrR family transcriptional regulator
VRNTLHVAAAPRTRRRLTGDDRRRQILAAARSCIIERGLAVTSVRDIAAAAGVSSGTVTHHFPAVDAILAGVLREDSARFRESTAAAMARGGTILDRLIALAEHHLGDEPEVAEHWRLWMDFWARAAHDPEMAAWQRERYRTWIDVIAQLLRDGMRSGEIAESDAETGAVELVALLDGLGVQVFSHQGGVLTAAKARGCFEAVARARFRVPDPHRDDEP